MVVEQGSGLIVRDGGSCRSIRAVYLYVGDSIRVDRERMEKLQEAQELARVTYEKLENAHTEILLITNELKRSSRKAKLANELVERLEGFLSKLEYLFLSESEKRKVDNELAQAKNEKRPARTAHRVSKSKA